MKKAKEGKELSLLSLSPAPGIPSPEVYSEKFLGIPYLGIFSVVGSEKTLLANLAPILCFVNTAAILCPMHILHS